MIWILVIFIILLLGGIAVVAAGYGRSMDAAAMDRVPLDLPKGKLTRADLKSVRFNTAIRGYRMDEVDELLARLAAQIGEGTKRDSDPERKNNVN
jgi:DivIVA domain-containing protein